MRSRTWSRLEWAFTLALLLAGSTTSWTLMAAADAKADELNWRAAQIEHLGTVMDPGSRGVSAASLRVLDGLYSGHSVVLLGGEAGAVLGLAAAEVTR